MDVSVRKVHFNALPEVTRRRLVDAIEGRGQPAPILSQKTAGWSRVAGWIVLGLVLLGGCVFTLSYEFGTIRGAGRQGFEYLAALLAGAWLAGYSLLAALRHVFADRAMPMRRGRYLFPTDLVVAIDPMLRVYPLAKLQKLDPVHHFRNGVYSHTEFNFYFEGGHREAFSVANRAGAEQSLNWFNQTGYTLTHAAQAQDAAMLQSLDVLFEARDHPLWRQANGSVIGAPHQAPVGPSARSVPVVLGWASLTALIAVGFAVPIWFGRNYLSDEEAFDRAAACGTTGCFNSYLRGDGRHREQVENDLLPAAAFREAQDAGTVTALREFVVEYPGSRHVQAARQVIHQRFEQVRSEFMTQANTADPNMPAFMGDLLQWLELNDSPPVLVRFNAPTAQMLEEIDRNLPQNTSPVAPHFTPERSEPRERYITQVLQRGFAAVFPDDVMRLDHFGRLSPTAPSETTHATFDVSYVVRPSGAIYVDDTNGRQFIGITNNFIVRMAIPGMTRTHSFQLEVEPPQRFSVGYSHFGALEGGPTDGAVYTTMAERAFEQLGTQLPLVFFRPGTPAYQQAISGQPTQLEPTGVPGLPPGLPDVPASP